MPLLSPDSQCADLCHDLYDTRPLEHDWAHIDLGLDDGVFWALKKLAGVDVVVFRGSTLMEDWIRDFRASTQSTAVGHVHAGFFAGMEQVFSEVLPLLTQPVTVTGHSLGAGRADVLCALMASAGVESLSRRVVFGEPKPGFVDFGKLIEKVPGASYRNGDDRHHDLVTDVPFSFPPFQYVHPTPVVPVLAEPTGELFDRWGVFAYHHIQLYQQALRTMESATS